MLDTALRSVFLTTLVHQADLPVGELGLRYQRVAVDVGQAEVEVRHALRLELLEEVGVPVGLVQMPHHVYERHLDRGDVVHAALLVYRLLKDVACFGELAPLDQLVSLIIKVVSVLEQLERHLFTPRSVCMIILIIVTRGRRPTEPLSVSGAREAGLSEVSRQLNSIF